jgi:hypothetical protein
MKTIWNHNVSGMSLLDSHGGYERGPGMRAKGEKMLHNAAGMASIGGRSGWMGLACGTPG